MFLFSLTDDRCLATTVATSTAPITTVHAAAAAAATTTYFNDTRCGWSANGPAPTPVQSCEADGVTVIDQNTQSVCRSGNAYMCSNQQPWNVSETLSYAYVGANIVVSINLKIQQCISSIF
jgi:hypothetical protein